MRKYQTGQAALATGEPAEPQRIFVVIGGGLVQAVYSTEFGAECWIIDHDTDYNDAEAWQEYEQNRALLDELYEAQTAHMVY